MRITVCAVIALSSVAVSTSAQSPRPLTLGEARHLARDRSPELRAARHAADAAAARARQAGAFSNPTLSYSREQASRTGSSNSQDIVTLEQPLDISGWRTARRDAASLRHRAAEARVEEVAARVDHDVARTYTAALAADRRATLAATAASAFERAVRVSAARLADGDVSGYQHRRLSLEAARYSALRLAAVVSHDSAAVMLRALLGAADSVGIQWALVDTMLPAPITVAADSLLVVALGRPDIRAVMLEVDAAIADARVARAERIPVPVLLGGYKRENVGGGAPLTGFVAGLSFTLPAWDRRTGAIAAATAESARRDADVASLRRQAALEVTTALAAHQSLAAQLELLRPQLGDNATAALRAAESAFGEGEIALLEWLDAVRAYHDASTLYVTLWAEYVARRAALERAIGAPLS